MKFCENKTQLKSHLINLKVGKYFSKWKGKLTKFLKGFLENLFESN